MPIVSLSHCLRSMPGRGGVMEARRGTVVSPSRMSAGAARTSFSGNARAPSGVLTTSARRRTGRGARQGWNGAGRDVGGELG